MASLSHFATMDEKMNYYQVLGLESVQHASRLPPQDVKAAYKRALLHYHPDKNCFGSTDRSHYPPEKLSVAVDDVALAYKVLSEPRLRFEYDRWLLTKRLGENPGSTIEKPLHTGLESVDLVDVSYDSETSTWRRGCRCGDEQGFIVSEVELEKNTEEGELIVGCNGCSLWLRVLFGVEE